MTNLNNWSAVIIGYGVVGTSTAAALAAQGILTGIVDPAKGYEVEEAHRQSGWWFVCVPTPYEEGAGANTDAVEDALDSVCATAQDPKRVSGVVIRSTIPPGTTERLQHKFTYLPLVHWPEFLTEATAVRDGIDPKRVVIGYTDRSVVAAAQLMDLVKGGRFADLVPATAAELVKYAANTFYATKVAWANQLYDLCDEIGVDYEVVRRSMEADPMCAAYHLDVHHKGFRGYGGKCLPKDTKALLHLAKEHGVSLSVLATADAYNDGLVGEGKS